MRLALLLKASANRVYGESAYDLARAELALLDGAVHEAGIGEVERATIGGVDYLVAAVDGALGADELAVVSNLSSLHALFAVEGDLLRPLPIRPRRCQDEDIVTIQRYAGKTNEAFTHLLVNAALAATGDGFVRLLRGERLRLLDPACGRGTTLNRAVVYGLDAVGIEHDGRDVEAYETFLLTWLKDKRLKHSTERARLRKGRATPARRLQVTYGAARDRAEHRRVEIVHDDTRHVLEHVAKRSVDLLVCDLPYGVQHGARTASGTLERGPEQLLAEALPGWIAALRPGAGVALAWNLRTLARPVVAAALADAGCELVSAADDAGFRHRVDRAILRDVLVARRPA